MGFLDSALGSLMGGNGGASAEQVLATLLQQHGGIGGLVGQLSQGGLGAQVASWVGNGQNLTVTATEITQALGSGPVAALAQKVGINPQEAGELLAKAIPHLVDHMTPGGQLPPNATVVPQGDVLASAVRAIAAKLLA
jgi:uncharacterized protein YidB (DUF937 family)